MKFTVALIFTTLATASPLSVRQDDALTIVNDALDDARSASANSIMNTQGEGRQLLECGRLCTQCRNGAITTALGEVALCGTAALAVEVATAGIATILEVAGFVACETAVIGTLNTAEAECQGLADP
ncbi:hypothetical protein BKA56DRAFT_618407 [Ilyonectria sp. MPI-CAGE-AT-0026]|nr:hypothetical protein BKA56DRAFT_618407 [Ilyonectria sp. MPI-CAGE-AT-0026]